MAGKLIMVSNREPYFIKRGASGDVVALPNTGGLTSALDPLLRSSGGLWISWSGFERELPKDGGAPLPERVDVQLAAVGEAERMQELPPYTLRRIPLTEREASLYYYGFANRTLWPLCHQFLGRVEYDPEAYRAYRRVNQRFVDAVLEEVRDDQNFVWIHDYHLALVPAMLRAARPDLRIGFSWHIPWPPSDVMRALPWARELIEGVLGADVVGFHLPRYARHFEGSVREIVDRPVEEGRVRLGGRDCEIAVAAMGPDVAEWNARARAARGGRAIRLRRNLAAERLILSVDRLDFTKGLPERLDAIEHFFDRYPSYRGQVVFCQIAVPSRTRVEAYRELKKAIDERVAKINARFQTASWQPVRYFYRGLEPDDLAVYYVAADVALVSPLRDGLGLPALEYVSSRIHEDGVVVLSELAGAADLLREAVRVNPNSPDLVSAALRAALEMSPDEARARMRALRERVTGLDVGAWRRDFTQRAFGAALEQREPMAAAPEAQPAPAQAQAAL
jgi:trehalose 6-phosphate synthase